MELITPLFSRIPHLGLSFMPITMMFAADMVKKPYKEYATRAEVQAAGQLAVARAQIEVGAQLIGVGDAASSQIGPELYARFAFPRTKRLIDAIHQAGAAVRLHICGSISQIGKELAKLELDMLDVDSMNPMEKIRAVLGDAVWLCGNLDPVRSILNGTPGEIREETAAMGEYARSRS